MTTTPTSWPPAVNEQPSFDTITLQDLRATGSMKWVKFPDALAAFVAEMDFGLAAPIAEAVAETMARGVTGYLPPWMAADLQQATAEWYAERHQWQLDPNFVHPVADVIRAYEFAIERFSRPGSRIVLMTPAYAPFFQLPMLHGRATVEVPLTDVDGSWEFDFDGLDAAMAGGGGLLVLCNPHNPLGKVYTRAELTRICEIVDAHGGRVFSDEVHAPLIHDGSEHIPYASLNEVAAGHTITATSASKAFNLPGLKCAQLIASNTEDQDKLDMLGMYITHGAANVGVAANAAAYRHGRPWLASVMDHLAGNRTLIADLLATHLPETKSLTPAATYFQWIDTTALGLGGNARDFFLEHAGVALTDGETFGAVGTNHVRFNFAMPRALMTDAIEAMAEAVRRHG